MNQARVLFDTPAEAKAYLLGFRDRENISPFGVGLGDGETEGSDVVFSYVADKNANEIRDYRKPPRNTISREVLELMQGCSYIEVQYLAYRCGMELILDDEQIPPSRKTDILRGELVPEDPECRLITDTVRNIRVVDTRQLVD